jgi:hypothetical protein
MPNCIRVLAMIKNPKCIYTMVMIACISAGKNSMFIAGILKIVGIVMLTAGVIAMATNVYLLKT